jgi:hypothetical protein
VQLLALTPLAGAQESNRAYLGQHVMSSGLGSIAGNESAGWEVDRARKLALAAATRSFVIGDGRGFVVIAPRWMCTDMRGPHAPLGVEDSVPGIADAIGSQAGRTDVVFSTIGVASPSRLLVRRSPNANAWSDS